MSKLTRTIAAHWHDYWDLTKPKVVALIVFTALVGMALAIPTLPTAAPVMVSSSSNGGM